VQPIEYFNRHTGCLETEAIHGERWLRWLYNSPAGQAALHTLVKRRLFSRFYGWLMDRPSSAQQVAPFVQRYGLDESEFAQPTASFRTFNEFFSRKLNPAARPVDTTPGGIVFPADGRHLLLEDAEQCVDVFVKGTRFNLSALLQDETWQTGSVLISRLCPTDYHRYHFPFSCTAGVPRRIAGPLFSVSPIALAKRPSILWENERYVTPLQLADGQPACFVEVGATCVGSIHPTSAPGPVEKAAEKGAFRFGGSTVILVLPKGSAQWAADLRHHSSVGRELYARMGTLAGHF
jgi:phosphatidylserine decarboxylase